MSTNLLRIAVLLVTLTTLSLTGCVVVTTQERQAKDCHDANDCRVQVSLIDCGKYTCHAKVDPDELRLHGNNVDWELSQKAIDDGFKFQPEYGIFLKTLDGSTKFKCNVAEQGTKFHCNNNAGAPVGKEYKYGVQLVGPKSVWVLDPWIVN